MRNIYITQKDVWHTPSGINHIIYFECVMCGDRAYKRPVSVSRPCPRMYPRDFPNWVTPWRPDISQLVNGHYYSQKFLTLNWDELPEGIAVEAEQKRIVNVQRTLFG